MGRTSRGLEPPPNTLYGGTNRRSVVPYRWASWITMFLPTLILNFGPKGFLSAGRADQVGVAFSLRGPALQAWRPDPCVRDWNAFQRMSGLASAVAT